MTRKGKRKPPPLPDELEAKMREQYAIYYSDGFEQWDAFVKYFPIIDDTDDRALGDAYRTLLERTA
jgi:hypothetical protein